MTGRSTACTSVSINTCNSVALPLHGRAVSTWITDRLKPLAEMPCACKSAGASGLPAAGYPPAPPQRRHIDAHLGNLLEQVAAQAAVRDGAVDAGVERGDRLDVEFDHSAFAIHHDGFAIAQDTGERAWTRAGASTRLRSSSVPPHARYSAPARLIARFRPWAIHSLTRRDRAEEPALEFLRRITGAILGHEGPAALLVSHPVNHACDERPARPRLT